MASVLNLDDLGDGIRNPFKNDRKRKLFLFYEGDFTEKDDKGSLSAVGKATHDGGNGLRAKVTSGNLYLYFNTQDDKTASPTI